MGDLSCLYISLIDSVRYWGGWLLLSFCIKQNCNPAYETSHENFSIAAQTRGPSLLLAVIGNGLLKKDHFRTSPSWSASHWKLAGAGFPVLYPSPHRISLSTAFPKGFLEPTDFHLQRSSLDWSSNKADTAHTSSSFAAVTSCKTDPWLPIRKRRQMLSTQKHSRSRQDATLYFFRLQPGPLLDVSWAHICPSTLLHFFCFIFCWEEPLLLYCSQRSIKRFWEQTVQDTYYCFLQ